MGASSHHVGRAICEAVGLDPSKVVKLVLTSEVNKCDLLEVTMHAFDLETNDLVEELNYFKLEPMIAEEKTDRDAGENEC